MTRRTTGTSKKRVSRLVGLTAAIASVVLMTAAPAHAVGANEGFVTGGEGYETSITIDRDFGDVMAEPPIFCLEVTEQENTVQWGNNDNPEFNATDSPDSATYTKQTDLTWITTETMYIAPEGIYGGLLSEEPDGSGCDPETLGDPIAATATVSGDTGAGSITCESDPGAAEYSRTGDQVTVTWEGTCTIVDDNGGDPVETPLLTITYEGTETPCFGPPFNCEHSTLDGTLSYEPV
jgi:hypothetical protein